MNPDLEEALELLADGMSFDKRPTEEEYEEWCNECLPLMKEYGYFKGWMITGD